MLDHEDAGGGGGATIFIIYMYESLISREALVQNRNNLSSRVMKTKRKKITDHLGPIVLLFSSPFENIKLSLQ